MKNKDDRDTIEALKSELDFIEKGGYGRSVKSPWQPTSIFQDSPTCLNLADLAKTHPCDECLLLILSPRTREQNLCLAITFRSTHSEQTIDELEWKEDQPRTGGSSQELAPETIDKLEEQPAA